MEDSKAHRCAHLPLAELEALARRLMSAYEQRKSGALLAKECGDALNEIKSRLPHGQFGDWRDRHFKGGRRRRAQQFQQVASGWDSLPEDMQHDPDLSVKRVLDFLNVASTTPSRDPDALTQGINSVCRELRRALESWTPSEMAFLVERCGSREFEHVLSEAKQIATLLDEVQAELDRAGTHKFRDEVVADCCEDFNDFQKSMLGVA